MAGIRLDLFAMVVNFYRKLIMLKVKFVALQERVAVATEEWAMYN